MPMADRPIIFSAPMVRALLDSRKTQTRRRLAIRGRKGFTEFGPSDTRGYDWHFRDAQKRWHDLRHAELLARLPWQVGDRLWVRENCWTDYQGVDGNGVRYQADGAWIRATDEQRWAALDCYAHNRHPDNATNTGQLVPSIHMPRWASRLTLTVTDVRVQRLQEITEADAQAEGATMRPTCNGFMGMYAGWCMDWSRVGHMSRWGRRTHDSPAKVPLTERDISLSSPSMAFASYWNDLHGSDAWDANPHVVALTFTVEQRNIDAP